jgi:hypothetical protein
VAFLPFGAARPNRDLNAASIQLNKSIGDGVGRSVILGRGHHEQAANFKKLV